VGWGLSGLDGIIEEWDGVGIVEISGPRRVGKSVSFSILADN
jgi:DNA repair protein RAD51